MPAPNTCRDNVDVPFYCNAVAFVMINLSSLLAIMLVAVCARIYTQISFWSEHGITCGVASLW
tara:strand:- start:144 stop:332 length:189 start_codon:yes stop_codon:yes gene_type:complete